MAFSRIVFGPEHRYGTGTVGTEASLKAFTVQDLRAFHASFYQPSNATLIVVGDVTADSVVPLLEQQFGQWRPAGTVTHATIRDAAQPARTQIYLVDKADAEQSQIRIGWVGVSRATPDYFPLQVLNTILGGSFTSRLNQNLRERNQYSYGAASTFDMRLGSGPFIAAAGVQTDKTADALREFFNELRAIRMPIPADEVAKAKNYIALGFAAGFETTGDIAAALEELAVYRLPDDYYERYVANVQAVTPEAVQRAAMRYLDPSRLAVVVVGDRQAIEAGVRALNLAPVRVMTVDEALGS
jgi:predicted Zn-dependent peptidase